MSVAYIETSSLVATAFNERGANLWHIATVLYLAREPSAISFVTLDDRQRTVATALGFQV